MKNVENGIFIDNIISGMDILIKTIHYHQATVQEVKLGSNTHETVSHHQQHLKTEHLIDDTCDLTDLIMKFTEIGKFLIHLITDNKLLLIGDCRVFDCIARNQKWIRILFKNKLCYY